MSHIIPDQAPDPHTPAPLSPEREQEIRELVPQFGTIAELVAELDRVRADRDQFADRVDTLTAVAKGNKRHVQEMYADLQKAQAEATCADCGHLKSAHDADGDRNCDASGARLTKCTCAYYIPGGGAA